MPVELVSNPNVSRQMSAACDDMRQSVATLLKLTADALADPLPPDDSGDRLGPAKKLCHDLIEPAATIRLLARAAETDLPSEVMVRERLRLIAGEAAQITTVCEHVLGDPGGGSSIRLDQFASRAVDSARCWYPGSVDSVTEPVAAQADPATVIRILNNLLINACRAAGPGGRVRVTAERAGGRARLAVADSGHGLGSSGPGRRGLGLEIVAGLALGAEGTVQLSVGDLGGFAVAVHLPPAPMGGGEARGGPPTAERPEVAP
jgi:signal transduction histidine kinase